MLDRKVQPYAMNYSRTSFLKENNKHDMFNIKLNEKITFSFCFGL